MPKPYTPNDKWSQRAAAEGFRARSVYKLQELDSRYKLLREGMKVLDLGAAPGSWLQEVSNAIGPKGKAIGLDLTPIEPIAANVETLVQDVTDIPTVMKILEERGMPQVNLVLSDMAPSTSGIKDVDQWKSVELCQAVLNVADACLRPNGTVVMKIFRGADFDAFLAQVRLAYNEVKVKQVEASRDRSREVYIVGRGKMSV
jgi:23S rRNA (uridine2552-2'-O)-methyltransferase